MTHQDCWGRYHDKQCTDGKPSSNNGWLYTAYAHRLGIKLDDVGLMNCYLLCCVGDHVNRSPDKAEPPMSRDEVLGITTLITMSFLVGWSFSPYPIPKFSLSGTGMALYRMMGAHRNALWDNGGEPHMFRFGFSVPLQDRAYILRTYGQYVPLVYRIAEYLSNLTTPKTNSGKLIRWLKGGTRPPLNVWEEYFGLDHPFTNLIRKEVHGETL